MGIRRRCATPKKEPVFVAKVKDAVKKKTKKNDVDIYKERC